MRHELAEAVRRSILETLSPEQVRLYKESAWFKQSVDTFAAFIPILIDGLAARAREWEVSMQERVKELEKLPLPPLPECNCGKGAGVPGENHASSCPWKVWR